MPVLCIPAEEPVRHLEIYSDDVRPQRHVVIVKAKAAAPMIKLPSLTRRRFMIATGSTVAAMGASSAWGQRLTVNPGEGQLPIAIPAFVPGTPADGQAGADI